MLDQPSSEQIVSGTPADVKPVVAPLQEQPKPVQQQATEAAGAVTDLLGKTAQLVVGKPLQAQPNVNMDEKIWAGLSYIPMVAAVAVVIKPKSDYVKLHARQGLLLFILFIASILLYVLLFPLGAVLGGLMQLALFVVGVFSIYQAVIGNWWKIPFLGDIAEKLPVEKFVAVTTEAVTGQQVQPVNEQDNSADSSQK